MSRKPDGVGEARTPPQNPYEKPTVITSPAPGPSDDSQTAGDPAVQSAKRTILVRPGTGQSPGGQPVSADLSDAGHQFVTGWLVITEGPGRGTALTLGMGRNVLGRMADAGNQITADFGDLGISASDHASINYDNGSRKFKAVHTNGTNMTYVNGQALDVPTPLAAGDTIRISQTSLRFVPLCGPDFDWA